MSSPFPGMDPYFEGEVWTTFHTQFGTEIARQLAPKLAPRYIARAEKRYIVESLAVWVEIRDVRQRKLVTAIEILSPTNKTGRGRREYLRKRASLLQSSAHLVEIDLIRTGRRLPMRKRLPPVPYFVFLSRAERRPITEIWPVRFDQALPEVPVPLLPGDHDVFLDLQAALATVYDVCRYDLEIDYTQPPDPPLPPEKAAWLESIVRASVK